MSTSKEQMQLETKESKDKKEDEMLLKDLIAKDPSILEYLPENTPLDRPIHEPVCERYMKSPASVLHFACVEKIPELAEILLKQGVAPNVLVKYVFYFGGGRNVERTVPLLYEAMGGLPRNTFELFLTYADINMRGELGYSVIDFEQSDYLPHRTAFQGYGSENFKVLLAYIYKSYVDMKSALAGGNSKQTPEKDVTFPDVLAGIVTEYCLDPLDHSELLKEQPAHRQKAFLGYMKRSYEQYVKEKRMEKLCNLPDKTLDELISLATERQKSKATAVTFQYDAANASKEVVQETSASKLRI